jgi:hypothetical protein
MAYEVFTKKVPRMGTPRLSFSKMGQFAFNQPAARIFQKETVEHVLLLWDASANKLAIKSTSNKKDARAYTIRYNDRGNGATFSAKTFLDYIGVDISERHTIPIEITPNHEYLVEVKIPADFFKTKQQPLRLEKNKAAAV